MKKLIIGSVIAALSCLAFSQAQTYQSRIQLTASNFYVPKGLEEKIFKPALRSVGIAYLHQITPKIRVGAAYSVWYSWNKLSNFIPVDGNGYYEDVGPMDVWKKGDLRARYDYRFFELSGNYTISQTALGESYAGVGLSYATGKNTVTESISNIPWAIDWVVQSTVEKKSYVGALVQAGYDFFLFRKRMTLGLSETVKYYPALPLQYYTNLNIGYNFSLRKR
jgi:hypothetical protein